MAVLLDSGFLLASLISSEAEHQAKSKSWRVFTSRSFWPVPAITEVAYLLARDIGNDAAADFISSLTALESGRAAAYASTVGDSPGRPHESRKSHISGRTTLGLDSARDSISANAQSRTQLKRPTVGFLYWLWPTRHAYAGDAKIRTMIMTTAKVTNGVIQIDSKDLPDGTTITLLAQAGDETFELDAAQESELLAAIAEAERGELVSASEFLSLRHSGV